MAFDGIITKNIASELQNLRGARIDKIFQPNQNLILIGLYLNRNNYCLLINTDSKNYHINLTTHSYENPKVAPNFCMVLRKYLLGMHIKNIITSGLERIVTIELEGLDDIDDLISKKIIIELMGKHCNVILIDDEYNIIDSLRHINSENSTHIVVPHKKYHYPDIHKNNFLESSSFDEFYNSIYSNIESVSKDISIDINYICTLISNLYNGISKNQIIKIKEYSNNTYNNLEDFLEYLYYKLRDLVFEENTIYLSIASDNKDYWLENTKKITNKTFHLNFCLDDFYFKKETSEILYLRKETLTKQVNLILTKYKKRLSNISKKLEETNLMENYRIYGELITANLYRIAKNKISSIKLENYYDNNKVMEIKLDSKYTPQENSRRFFKKYNKLKNALEICSNQKNDTLNEIVYLESILFELENSNTIENLKNIQQEISEINNYSKANNFQIKKRNLNKKNPISFSPIKYTIENYTLLIGRNNKENDYLTLKYANSYDLWLHTKDIHGSHGILLLTKENYELFKSNHFNIIKKAAEIVSFHSKARNSENVPVDYTLVKYVKKAANSKPGMVIYTNQNTIFVNPKKE